MQNPKCPQDLTFYDLHGTVVILRPSIPTWAAIGRDGLSLLKLCTGALTAEEIAQRLDMDSEGVHEFIQTLEEYKILGEEESVEAASNELRSIWLHVTNACNLSCLTCYHSAGKACPEELSVEEITELLMGISEFKPQNEAQTVALTGGEPLLRSDFWLICEACYNLGFNINLFTNGTLINEDIAEMIKSFVGEVRVGLDGIQQTNDKIRGKGSFERIVRGIKTLLDVGIVPMVNITATKANYAEIPELLDFLIEMGVTALRVRPVMYQGRGSTNKSQLGITSADYELLVKRIYERGYSSHPDLLKVERFADNIRAPVNNRRGCVAGWCTVSISAMGEVYPCVAGHISSLQLGSIRQQPFRAIWNNAAQLSEWRSFDVNTSSHCSNCEWRNFCGGGCKLNAFLRCGKIDGGDQHCEAFKNLYSYTLLQEAVL